MKTLRHGRAHGRQLMLAWQLHADENQDEVLPGYTSQAEALRGAELQDMRHWCNAADRPDWTSLPLP